MQASLTDILKGRGNPRKSRY